jgi:hypothetical protein
MLTPMVVFGWIVKAFGSRLRTLADGALLREGLPGAAPGFMEGFADAFRGRGRETGAGAGAETADFFPRIRSKSFSVDEIVSFFFGKAATCLQSR